MTTFVACNAKFFPPPWVINDDTVVGYYLTKLKKIAGHCQLNNMAPMIFLPGHSEKLNWCSTIQRF